MPIKALPPLSTPLKFFPAHVVITHQLIVKKRIPNILKQPPDNFLHISTKSRRKNILLKTQTLRDKQQTTLPTRCWPKSFISETQLRFQLFTLSGKRAEQNCAARSENFSRILDTQVRNPAAGCQRPLSGVLGDYRYLRLSGYWFWVRGVWGGGGGGSEACFGVLYIWPEECWYELIMGKIIYWEMPSIELSFLKFGYICGRKRAGSHWLEINVSFLFFLIYEMYLFCKNFKKN